MLTFFIIRAEDLPKKLINTKNIAGFLIRHIGDVELLFAINVFGATDLKVHAKTVSVPIWKRCANTRKRPSTSSGPPSKSKATPAGRKRLPPKSSAPKPKPRPWAESFRTRPTTQGNWPSR